MTAQGVAASIMMNIISSHQYQVYSV